MIVGYENNILSSYSMLIKSADDTTGYFRYFIWSDLVSHCMHLKHQFVMLAFSVVCGANSNCNEIAFPPPQLTRLFFVKITHSCELPFKEKGQN